MFRRMMIRAVAVACLYGGWAAPSRAQYPDEQPADAIETCLTNVRQLTFTNMGFKAAGEAYFAPDGGTVIFQAIPEGQEHYQIYTLSLAESTPRMVSTGRGATTCAYFHPSGKKIIYASSHLDPRLDNPALKVPTPGYKRDKGTYSWDFNPYMDIFEADLDGSNLHRLTGGDGVDAYDAEGAFSPDGKLIAFASNRAGNMEIFVMDADGGNVRQVTHTEGCYNGGPFISPDGKRIVFRADRQKRDYLQLYMIDVDGTNEVQLTDNGEVNWAPFWHPNGKTLAFTTSIHGHHNYEVYLMNVDTRELRRATYSPRFDGLPVFSPDGKKMMWTSQRGEDHTSQVFLADFTPPEGS